jgi:acyl-CoA reductase-like NAD-dependent aldehyde dehydrogenase
MCARSASAVQSDTSSALHRVFLNREGWNEMQTEQRYQNYIGGKWVDASSDETNENHNPANPSETLGRFPRSTREDVQRAVESATRAFQDWRRISASERSTILDRAGQIMERRAEEIGRALTLEEGKTLAEGIGEAKRGASIVKFFAGEPWRPTGETYNSANPNTFLYSERVPLGVVGIITPWNFPVAIPIWKLAPCLAYGNVAIFKPAELTPLTAHLITEVFAEAGLPAGVLNLVHGPGSVVGDELSRNPGIHGVSFTGSGEVGRNIYAIATAHGARVQLELGGKNPVVVAADARLDQAVDIVLSGAMRSTGQKCTATSRVIVEQPVAGAFTEALVERVKGVQVGPGIDSGTYMGPLVSSSAQKTVLDYIDVGKQEGARLLAGGDKLGGEHAGGYFVAPTVFDNVSPTMRIAQEEIFGPVVGVIRAGDLDEAIRIANGVKYGLSASIVTSNIATAFHFVRSIEAGVVHVNSETAGAEPHVPFGGVKESSSFSREQGRAAMDFYTQTRTVYLDMPS